MKRMIPAGSAVKQAFTIIELLAVIAIIGILAGFLLTALSEAKIKAQKNMVKGEEVNLIACINQYYAQYSRLPASAAALAAANGAAGSNANYGDFTFGTFSNNVAMPNLNPQIQTYGETSPTYQNNNSEVIAILRDDNYFPESSGYVQHIYNPAQHDFFTGKIAMDNNSPGIGSDDVLRDPWGMPYIVTLDLAYTGKCYDKALDQMYQLNPPTAPGPLLIPGEAVVWSFGPSRTVQLNSPLNSTANPFNHLTVTTSF